MAETHDNASILFPPLPFDMHERAAGALRNAPLRLAVMGATTLKDDQRKHTGRDAFGERHDTLRELAGRIKQHTLDHLDWYLERFVEAAERAGARVHFAADAAQANAIALDIARKESCKLCVKGKSMVTEETHLLAALQSAGIETWETDLAEFIIQLDHDAPSHIVTAMIHKDRAAVGRAFTRELGVPYTDDPETLTRIARDFLRDKYRRSDLGISGANFLVADSGTIVLCTNEGNGRFCTTAPRVHIAFAGIEKLVPTREHLAVLLKLLARTSTAQPLTCYTNFITGPRRADEHDGPEQLHIILLDNGRTGILADANFRQALRCIRCGACLNACPVYRNVGGHAYGSVYSGPIGAVITPLPPAVPDALCLTGVAHRRPAGDVRSSGAGGGDGSRALRCGRRDEDGARVASGRRCATGRLWRDTARERATRCGDGAGRLEARPFDGAALQCRRRRHRRSRRAGRDRHAGLLCRRVAQPRLDAGDAAARRDRPSPGHRAGHARLGSARTRP